MNYSAHSNWLGFTDDQLGRMWTAIYLYKNDYWNYYNPTNQPAPLAQGNIIDHNIIDIKLINKKNNKLENLFISHGGFCGCKHLNTNFELTQLCKEDNCNIKKYIIRQIKFNKINKIFKKKIEKLDN